MAKNIRKKLEEEKAAVSVLVFITVLTFVVILLGAFLTVTTLRKSQLQSDIRLQQIYGEDVKRVNEIYEELISKDTEKPKADISYNINNDSSIIYKFTFNESVKGFEVNDIKLYSGNIINTQIESQFTLSTSTPAYTTTLTANKTYVISFDYKTNSATQEFELGLYSETQTDLPTKNLIASDTLKHEEYIINVNDINTEFKILANVQESNDVVISNFEIIQLNDDEVEKGAFVEQDSKTYTLVAEYNKSLKYVIILDENICTDLNQNKNQQTIKVI